MKVEKEKEKKAEEEKRRRVERAAWADGQTLTPISLESETQGAKVVGLHEEKAEKRKEKREGDGRRGEERERRRL
ncbi:hypothetical protein MMC16_004607 [Acarospora aff. strigata]|nr:hypothetical protein [Acarospora aff. strigata]